MIGDVGLPAVEGNLRLGVGDVGLPGVGGDRSLSFGVGDAELLGVEGVGVPEGEASLPCLLRLHPLQPRPGHQKCLRIFCNPSLSNYLHERLATHFLGATATLLLQEWLACSSFIPTLFSFSSASFDISCWRPPPRPLYRPEVASPPPSWQPKAQAAL